jgi:hypothetical protein
MKRRRKAGVAAVLTVIVAMAPAGYASEPDLSAAETTAVNQQIATLKARGDRRMA